MESIAIFAIFAISVAVVVFSGIKMAKLIARLISGPQAASKEAMSVSRFSLRDLLVKRTSRFDLSPKMNIILYGGVFCVMVSQLVKSEISHLISPAVILADINHWLNTPRGSLTDVPLVLLLLSCYLLFLITRNVRLLTAKDDVHYGEVPYQPSQQQTIIKEDRRFGIKNHWIQ